MSLPRIIERTFYPPLCQYLNSIGFETIGETGIGDAGYSDILFKFKDELFVIEVKLGKPTTTLSLKAMAQAERYAREYNTRNLLVLIFPEEYRNKPITSSKLFNRLALKEKATCIIFSDYWTDSFKESPSVLFDKLKQRIIFKERKIDFRTIFEQIKTFMLDFNAISYQIKTDEMVSEVVEKLDLFTAIGNVGEKDKETAKKQIINLSTYLLFNQLLFYHIYQRLVKDEKLPELAEIKKVKDIQSYFEEIKKIDYRAIYKTNILNYISDKPEVVDVLNQVIGAIKLLRAEYVTHDLAGRFFHELIPFKVRKILAAFYTHPNSADLLSGLTIDTWDESVTDPACGSGTLLVSSYQTKLSLYKTAHGNSELKKIHKRFLEEDITGIDIMPFASHITTMNLAMQDLEQRTNLVRIASLDSLQLSNQLKLKKFHTGNGIKISGFEKSIQQTLLGTHIITKKQGSVSMQGKGRDFYLTPVDTIIMNPPFSDREKMPQEMRDKINNNETLNRICGKQINLWGLFLVLSDLFLEKRGKLGAVVPINIARGKATQEIRDFLLKKYTARFIIKPTSDYAFSEGSSLKDILYIAEKRMPNINDYTGIVSIKSSLKRLDNEQVGGLIKEMKQCYKDKTDKETTDYQIKFIKTLNLLKYSDNLMPLLGFSSSKNKKLLNNFLETILKSAGKKLVKISKDIIEEGLHASPAGVSELVFITNPLGKSRTKKAFMLLEKTKRDSVQIKIKDINKLLEIPKSKIQSALRTVTNIKKFNVKNVDYILTQKPSNFHEISERSKFKGEFDWIRHRKNILKKESHLVMASRFRTNSVNTHHLAFFSPKKFVAPHTFKILKFDTSQESLLQSLILNSSLSMATLLKFREQTTGAYLHIQETELRLFHIFNINELSVKEKTKLENVFNALKNTEFPSLKEQYISNSSERRLLDSAVLEVLGIEKKQIDNILDKLYSVIAEELQIKE